jgi:hypothetical protein
MARKGQASLEYLLTYGWAILIIAAVIAIIIGSGIFSPKNSAANYAISPPQMPINSFLMTGSDANTVLLLNLSNNFGYKVKITGITLTYRDATVTIPESDTLGQGGSMKYSFDLNAMRNPDGAVTYPGRGTTAKVDMRVDFTNCYEPINTGCAASVGSTPATSTIPIYIIGYVE